MSSSAFLLLTCWQVFLLQHVENRRVKSSFLTYIFAFPINQSFFSTFYLFLFFVLHAGRTVIRQIPQCRTANRFPSTSCWYISDKNTFLDFWPKPHLVEKTDSTVSNISCMEAFVGITGNNGDIRSIYLCWQFSSLKDLLRGQVSNISFWILPIPDNLLPKLAALLTVPALIPIVLETSLHLYPNLRTAI